MGPGRCMVPCAFVGTNPRDESIVCGRDAEGKPTSIKKDAQAKKQELPRKQNGVGLRLLYWLPIGVKISSYGYPIQTAKGKSHEAFTSMVSAICRSLPGAEARSRVHRRIAKPPGDAHGR